MSLNNINSKLIDSTLTVASITSPSFGISQQDTVALQAKYTDTTPAPQTFASTAVDTTADTITITGHGYTTGLVGQFTTDDTLPTGISLLTNYFIIVVDANTVKIATSLVNALAGTAVNITAQGAGNDTFTPTAVSGSLQYKVSNDNVNWTNKGSAVSISASGSNLAEWSDVGFGFIQAVYTHTAGQVTILIEAAAKG